MTTDAITCMCATNIIPEGRGVMNDMRYITTKKMRVLGYGNVRGVNMNFYSRRDEVMEMAEKLRRDDLFTFLFVGRLVKSKGVSELVTAFEKLYAKELNMSGINGTRIYCHISLLLIVLFVQAIERECQMSCLRPGRWDCQALLQISMARVRLS